MLKQTLLTHARQYPLMEPQDAVKLLYQSQFGGGHIIQNEAACLEFLRREYAATPQINGPLLEDIGNGMVRVMLSALDMHGYTAEQLGWDFIRSANSVRGCQETFRKSLSLLEELSLSGQMPFSPRALTDYLMAYAAADYPVVSHSETYRNTYHPAYRVLQRSHLPAHIQKQV